MKRKIQWRYWRSPLERDPNEEWGAEADWAGRPDVDGDEEAEYDDGVAVRTVIPTAAGYLPTQVYTSMNRAFDFWTADVNFDLTAAVVDAIESHPGVETLDVMTRYRFRVGFGLAFDGAEVRRGLEGALTASARPCVVEEGRGFAFPAGVLKRVDAMRAATDEDGSHWAAIVLPNGQVHSIRGEDEEAVSARLDAYRKVQAAVGGVIYRNEDS